MGKDVFQNAIVDTNVLLVRHGRVGQSFRAVDVDKLTIKDFPPDESRWGITHTNGDAPWSILSPAEQRAMDKMRACGTPLKDWAVRINYGIKTGYNDAFIIDEATKNTLINESSRSDEIIKPILRGRDIQRYRAQWAGQYIIDTHNGYDSIPAISINDYLAVKEHLDKFYLRLEKRQDKGRTPYNLRSCAYHEEFDQEKLFWIELAESGRFAYDDVGMYGEATTFILTGESLKFLCAVLNADLTRWFLQQVAPTSGMGTLRWKKIYVETIPIPKVSAAEQHPFIHLVDDILTTKATDPSTDTSEQENEIDRLVYALYGLTEAEIAAVERR